MTKWMSERHRGPSTVGHDTAAALEQYAVQRQLREQTEREVDEMFWEGAPAIAEECAGWPAWKRGEPACEPEIEPVCLATKHGPRNSACTCEDSRD